MKDKSLIYAGLGIFLLMATFPFWFNLGNAAAKPEPVLSSKAKEAKACVMPTQWMRAEHMQVLDIWRTAVVRDGQRVFINESGKAFNMSLSNSCLDCHDNKAEFCDKCHAWASADPYCWDCHIDNPKEKK